MRGAVTDQLCSGHSGRVQGPGWAVWFRAGTWAFTLSKKVSLGAGIWGREVTHRDHSRRGSGRKPGVVRLGTHVGGRTDRKC